MTTPELTPEMLLDDNDESDSNQVPEPVTEMVELTEQFIEQGWGTETAKSVEHKKVDQSMLCHVSNAMSVIVRLYELTDAIDEADLRTLCGLLAAHDYHKMRDEPDPAKEFDIPDDEIEQFTIDTGLAEYVDDVPIDLFKATIVGLHKTDDHSRVAEAPLSFDKYRPFLHFADAVASTPHPREFTDLRKTYNLREALGQEYTVNHHEVKRPRGLVSNVLHQTVADVICSKEGYDLFTIYNEGCTYLGTNGEPEIPITDDLIGDIFTQFITNLKTAHSAFQNSEQMESAFTLNKRRHYTITDRDYFFLDQEEIIRTLVQKCVSVGQMTSPLPDSVEEDINQLDAHLDRSFEYSRRLDGIARLVHTVHTELVADLCPDNWSPIEMTCKLFTASPATKTAIETIREQNPVLVESDTHWPVKYLIAQDVIDRYYNGESPAETTDEITSSVCAVLKGHEDWRDQWSSIADDRAQDIYDELYAFILYNVSIDGQRLIRETSLVEGSTGRDEYDRYYNSTGANPECSLCNYPTTATPTDGFRLLKDYPPDTMLTHHDGTRRHIQTAEQDEDSRYCIPCQLDLALRFNRQEFDGNDRLYVHVMPDYFYTPMCWRLYRSIFDQYLETNTTDPMELAQSVSNTDAAHGYQTWLDQTLDSTAGIEHITDITGAFRPDTGFGTHAISQQRRDDITETEELFVALTAATYAGVRVYVTDSPLSYVTSSDFDTAVKLDSQFEMCEYTGEEISLENLDTVLRTTAAMLRLTNAAEHTKHGPLEALQRAVDMTPLPGALLLEQIADRNPEALAEHVADAHYIDDQLVAGKLAERDPAPPHAEEYPLDISLKSAIDAVEAHDAASALAEDAWPFMTPNMHDKDTLCVPLDAAFDAVDAVCDGDTNGVAYSELQTAIESEVAAQLSLPPTDDGRHVRGRVAAFTDTFLTMVVDSLCTGSLDFANRLKSTLRTAFYAAMLRQAITTDQLEVTQ